MRNKLVYLVSFVFVFCGCAHVAETGRVIWGSSIKALEDARVNGVSQTYACPFDGCFDAVLSLGRNQPSEREDQKKVFDVFQHDRIKSVIVVMGISGNVDTTEVGIFFTEMASSFVKVDISSRASSAKERVAEAVFEELDLRFDRM